MQKCNSIVFHNFVNFLKEGFIRARINGDIYDIGNHVPKLSINKKLNIEIVIDRILTNNNIYERLHQSIELAYKVGDGLIILNYDSKDQFFSENLFLVAIVWLIIMFIVLRRLAKKDYDFYLKKDFFKKNKKN